MDFAFTRAVYTCQLSKYGDCLFEETKRMWRCARMVGVWRNSFRRWLVQERSACSKIAFAESVSMSRRLDLKRFCGLCKISKRRFKDGLGICRRIVTLVAPHLLAIGILIAYLLFGSFAFCTIEGWNSDFTLIKYISNVSIRNETETNATADLIRSATRYAVDEARMMKKPSRMISWNMFDGVLFAYSTVTTIGYNDLTPVTVGGRVFYVLYAMVGVPLCTVVLVDWALFVEEFSHYLVRVSGLGRRLFDYDTRRYSAVGAELILLLPLAVVFFLLYVIAGALLLGLWETGWTLGDGFYAAFDAVTTIGIGDIRPSNHDYYPLTLVYVTVGIAVSSTCLTLAVNDFARLVHFAGRRASGCASSTVYFGSRRVRIDRLLEMVGREWAVDEAKVRRVVVGDRLDALITEAFQEKSRGSTGDESRPVGDNIMESTL